MNEERDLKQLLVQGSCEFNIHLNEHQVSQMMKYKETLLEWNEKINLTAIEEDKDVIIKHFLDSLSLLPYIGDKKIKMIDIGTGAGFPGIPLKIVEKDLEITLLDSLEKRVKFLDLVTRSLGLKGIKAIHGRAEDVALKTEHREKYDLVVARAVASLPILLEYCLPFVRVGGTFIAMKGSCIEEVEISKRALEVLGGKIEEVKEIVLPFSDIKRNFVIVKKLRHTPTAYPRKAGKPSKEPLL